MKSVLWRVEKRLSYIEDTRCLKVNSISKLIYTLHSLPQEYEPLKKKSHSDWSQNVSSYKYSTIYRDCMTYC